MSAMDVPENSNSGRFETPMNPCSSDIVLAAPCIHLTTPPFLRIRARRPSTHTHLSAVRALIPSPPLLPGCVGTQSDEAGKASGCDGCPNQAACASGATRAPDPGEENPRE